MSQGLVRINKILSQLDPLSESKFDDNAKVLPINENEDTCKIDHIIYFSKDLEKSIIEFSKLLGIKPIIGGRHLQWGSWNALFSLDNKTYFEIIADDPDSNIKHEGFLKQLVKNKPNGEGIINYMIRPPKKYNKNLKQFKHDIKKQINYDCGDIFGGERALNNDNTKILKWDLMCPLNINLKNNNDYKIYQYSKGIIPCIIDWQLNDVKIHPSYTSPNGCKLLEINCFHPNKSKFENILNTMNMENRFNLQTGDTAKIVVKILSPNGVITIS